MQIHWKKTDYCEHTGTDEKENYSLVVTEVYPLKYWKVFRDEDKIIDGQFEEYESARSLDEAKARAEKALIDYLNEQASFTNCLREVLQIPKPTQLENDIEEVMYKYDKP